MKNYFIYITTNPDKLLYWERFFDAKNAIARKKQLKRWSRKKKEMLIATINPNWDFLNVDVFAE